MSVHLGIWIETVLLLSVVTLAIQDQGGAVSTQPPSPGDGVNGNDTSHAAPVPVELEYSGSTDATWNDEGTTMNLTLDTLDDLPRSRSRSYAAPMAPSSIVIDLLAEHDSYLPKGYNKLEIPKKQQPNGNDDPAHHNVRVWVSMKIMSVLEIDEMKETIHLQLESVVSWFDYRIEEKVESDGAKYEYNDIRSLDLMYIERIWHPDLYMENLVSMTNPRFIGEPVALTIRPAEGEFFYKARLSPVVKCRFTFVFYPADTQKCNFELRSYSYRSEELLLSWLRNVELKEEGVANFELFMETLAKTNTTEQIDTLNVTYDILQFTLTARRKLSYHLIQTYLPSCIFIFITWLCFLLPSTMLEARIGISMTTLLTLTAMFGSVRSNAPVVSYVKAIDIWMVGCIFFVFITLAEFAVMIWIRHRYEKYLKETQLGTDVETKALIPGKEDATNDKVSMAMSRTLERPPLVVVGKFIDRYAVLGYSVAFFAFTIIYWSWLLIYAEYFSFKKPESKALWSLEFDTAPPSWLADWDSMNSNATEAAAVNETSA